MLNNGEKINHWTVLEYIPGTKTVPSKYLCRCDCGNIKEVNTYSLIHEISKSCGCERNKKLSVDFLNDISGKRFGSLLVIEKDKKKNNEWYWFCKCDCGSLVSVRGGNLKNGNTISCGCVKSKGEEKIIKILNQNNIKYEKEKTFDDCVFLDTGKRARFDFYLPEYNTIIEYDGSQHFKFDNRYWNTEEKFKTTQNHDDFKNQYCQKKGIKLVRIPYTKYNNLCLEDFNLD